MNPKILIVEDDSDITKLMVSLLESSGYTALTASDAVVAIAIARQEVPDLVVLDLGLPGGGGLTVLKRLRSLQVTSATPVLVVSAFGSTHRDAALVDGAQQFLEKPFIPDEFLEAVAALLIANP
ncbi:MAG: response regulator [Actinomycetota bacterium]